MRANIGMQPFAHLDSDYDSGYHTYGGPVLYTKHSGYDSDTDGAPVLYNERSHPPPLLVEPPPPPPPQPPPLSS